jgi:predicted branched-subunit amino acid permease
MGRKPLRSAFLLGMRDCAPFILVIVPFALLFGVLATEAGWNLGQTFAMSFVVIAGASQFAAVQLVKEGAPFLVIVLTGLAVNLRMAMYSASLAPHLGPAPLWQRALAAYCLTDQTYGVAIHRFTERPGMPLEQKMAYFLGAVLAICPLWYAFTIVGALAGQAIPPEFALDFAAPITFIALCAPALRSLPHLAAALVSVAAALALAWMPYNLWLPAAALLAMGAGAGVEVMLERKGAA